MDASAWCLVPWSHLRATGPAGESVSILGSAAQPHSRRHPSCQQLRKHSRSHGFVLPLIWPLLQRLQRTDRDDVRSIKEREMQKEGDAERSLGRGRPAAHRILLHLLRGFCLEHTWRVPNEPLCNALFLLCFPRRELLGRVSQGFFLLELI